MDSEILKIEKLNKTFDDKVVLKGIDLKVSKGEVIVIIGPSGSGKSTLLRCINHLEKPTSGNIFFKREDLFLENPKWQEVKDDKHLVDIRAQMPMVFQHFNLFPHKTALNNVLWSANKLHKRLTKKVKAKVKQLQKDNIEVNKEMLDYLERKDLTNKQLCLNLLEKVGLLEHKDKYPNSLSGGQKQRVAIARALSFLPNLVLFDEPTSALDPETVYEILIEMKKLANEGLTMLIVTHEMNFAKDVADKVIVLDNGEIIEQGTPKEVFNNSKSKRTKEFLSKLS